MKTILTLIAIASLTHTAAHAGDYYKADPWHCPDHEYNPRYGIAPGPPTFPDYWSHNR